MTEEMNQIRNVYLGTQIEDLPYIVDLPNFTHSFNYKINEKYPMEEMGCIINPTKPHVKYRILSVNPDYCNDLLKAWKGLPLVGESSEISLMEETPKSKKTIIFIKNFSYLALIEHISRMGEWIATTGSQLSQYNFKIWSGTHQGQAAIFAEIEKST